MDNGQRSPGAFLGAALFLVAAVVIAILCGSGVFMVAMLIENLLQMIAE